MEKWEQEKGWYPHKLAKVLSFLKSKRTDFIRARSPYSAYLTESAIVYLNRLEVRDSPWFEIDYDQSDSGKGCFDGKRWLLEVLYVDGSITGYVTGSWCNTKNKHAASFQRWITPLGYLECVEAKRCRPIPTSWRIKP